MEPDTIPNWFDDGVKKKAHWMVVFQDWFDYEYYPVYYDTDEEDDLVQAIQMSDVADRPMEVYDLTMDKDMQMQEYRAWHIPL